MSGRSVGRDTRRGGRGKILVYLNCILILEVEVRD